MPHRASAATDLTRLRNMYPWPKARPTATAKDHGWFREENQKILHPYLSPETRVIVEVGTWLGMSARWMLDKAPNAVCVCVDWWKGDSSINRSQKWARMVPTSYSQFLSLSWEYRDRIIPVKEKSQHGLQEIKRLVPDLVPDLVYLDADHEYPAVCDDLLTIRKLWSHQVPIVGDDWDPVQFPGVVRAVTEFLDGEPDGTYFHQHGKAWEIRPCVS